MCQALHDARKTMEDFANRCPTSYPPTVINIMDGEATDADPEQFADALCEVATEDGNLLLFNVHITSQDASPIELPVAAEDLPCEYSRRLYRMSSGLPPKMIDEARSLGKNVAEGARGLVFNADLDSLESVFQVLANSTKPAVSDVSRHEDQDVLPPPLTTLHSATTKPEYDVFISYRRQSGSQTARLILAELKQRGLRAFLDVEDLGPGHFDQSLLESLGNAPNFLVILSPHCFDRCFDENDYVRQEIAHAFRTAKNILPLVMPGFVFPEAEALPADIRPIVTHQGVTYNHEYFWP